MAKTKDIIYLDQLFMRETHELHQDEALLSDAFEVARKSSNNPVLSDLFDQGRRDSLHIVESLRPHLTGALSGKRKPALRGILDEGQHRVKSLGDNHLVDAELISTMQKLLGYQLAGYENLLNLSRMLRVGALEAILSAAIEQKRTTARQLSEVALHQVHWRANWWAPEHTSGWDRVKAAFRRDWEQTKAHVGAAPPLPEGEQRAGDTMAQIAGKQEIVTTSTFEANEPAFRYGYGAAHFYRDRQWDDDFEGELRTNYGGIWENARDHIRSGWDYARRDHGEQEQHLEQDRLQHDDGNAALLDHRGQREVLYVRPHEVPVEHREMDILPPEQHVGRPAQQHMERRDVEMEDRDLELEHGDLHSSAEGRVQRRVIILDDASDVGKLQ